MSFSTRRSISREDRLGIFAAFFLLFFLIFSFNGYSPDDAFISYRYAQNLSHGYGLVYNPNMPHVEGYTNFLWTLMLAAADQAKYSIPEIAVVFSTFFAVLTLVLIGVWMKQQRIFNDKLSISLPMLLLAAYPSLALWSATGMETTFFTFLLVAAIVIISWEERQNRSGWISGLVWIPLVLTRPEGIFFVLTISVVSLVESGRLFSRKGALFRRIFLPVLALSLHRWWCFNYYGSILPNTFYAKSGPLNLMIPPGMKYLVGMLSSGGGILLLFAFLALFIRPRIMGIRTILVTVLLYIGYTVAVGGDWMPAYRFYLPIMPLLVMAAALFLSALGREFPKSQVAITILVILNFWVFSALKFKPYMDGSTFQQLRGEPVQADVLKELGLHLREVADPFALLAAQPAGKVPYYSGLATIDMRGLNDRHIARTSVVKTSMPGHNKRDPEYVLSLKPDYIVLTGAVPKQKPVIKTSGIQPDILLDRMDILQEPAFKKCYKGIRVPLPDSTKDLFYYHRICLK